MLPIRDVNPTRITPWVTLFLIAASTLVFFGLQSRQSSRDQVEFLYRQAAISCEITTGQPLTASEINRDQCDRGSGDPVFGDKNPWLAVLTSMFLHGSLGHLLFNMWSFWIFGNNVEEAFGHFRYVLFYVFGGIVATLTFVVLNPDSTVPLIGASGAIATALGAYAVLFPAHRILTLLGWILLPIPAIFFLGFWFLSQFYLGGSGVAWEAHVGGFLAGLLLFPLLARRRGDASPIPRDRGAPG